MDPWLQALHYHNVFHVVWLPLKPASVELFVMLALPLISPHLIRAIQVMVKQQANICELHFEGARHNTLGTISQLHLMVLLLF